MDSGNVAAVGNAAPTRGFAGRLAASLARHPCFGLALIVALVILVVWLLVYYRGVLGIGPFGSKGAHGGGKGKSKKGDGGEKSAAGDATTAETERLISAINDAPAGGKATAPRR